MTIVYEQGKNDLKTPIHLEVRAASQAAIEAVEAIGGTVTCVHFNRLALRALMKPLKFDLLPRRARPPAKVIDYFLDGTRRGYLSPEVQIRNMKLFGSVTSEDKMRAEHERIMESRREAMRYVREQLRASSGADQSKDAQQN
jgi:hypothetical protein